MKYETLTIGDTELDEAFFLNVTEGFFLNLAQEERTKYLNAPIPARKIWMTTILLSSFPEVEYGFKAFARGLVDGIGIGIEYGKNPQLVNMLIGDISHIGLSKALLESFEHHKEMLSDE